MRILMKALKIIGYILLSLVVIVLLLCIWHHICNFITRKDISAPGNRIEIYDKEFIHAIKMGEGEYTVVFLPGMGMASPYYDFYKLASEVAKNNQVIIVEPFGYGFSDNTEKKRSLDNYEYELSKVLDYYSVKDNIILLGHSYSGISNLNYANKHEEVKGLVCLDCTTAYQIETHVKDGKFIEKVPKQSKLTSLVTPLGITRFVYSTIMSKEVKKSLLEEVPKEYHKAYKYLLYNKSLNTTVVNEINDIYYNQLELLDKKYREDLTVVTILSDETIEEMKEYKKEGDFKKDWEEMHNALISNENIQHIYTLKGNHLIYHGNVDKVSSLINEMIEGLGE